MEISKEREKGIELQCKREKEREREREREKKTERETDRERERDELNFKYYTRTEVCYNEKHTSLLSKGINIYS